MSSTIIKAIRPRMVTGLRSLKQSVTRFGAAEPVKTKRGSDLPRLSHPPIMTEGPLAARHVEGNPWQPPASWKGTEIEWMVYLSLNRRGLQEGLHFRYQSAVEGGYNQIGGMVTDFVVFDPPIALNVQGNYYHYEMGAVRLLTDRQQFNELTTMGYLVVRIDEEDILSNVDYYVGEALLGHDHSRASTGV